MVQAMAAGFSETGTQLFARLGTKPVLDSLDPRLFPKPLFPQPGNVVEFYGTTCCAKTELLYHIIAQCILPSSWHGIELSGQSVGVVFVDNELQFSMLRLFAIMEKRITQILEMVRSKQGNDNTAKEEVDLPTSDHIESFIKLSLSKLYLVRCNSSEELIITLHSLESLFANHPEMGVLMLDCISAFYWIDRTNAGNGSVHQESMQRKMADILCKLIQEYQLVLFTTKPAIVQKRHRPQQDVLQTVGAASPHNRKNLSSQEQIDHHEYMCNEWHKLVTYRFIIRRQEELLNVSTGNITKRSIFKATLIHPSTVKHQCTFSITDSGVSYL